MASASPNNYNTPVTVYKHIIDCAVLLGIW